MLPANQGPSIDHVVEVESGWAEASLHRTGEIGVGAVRPLPQVVTMETCSCIASMLAWREWALDCERNTRIFFFILN